MQDYEKLGAFYLGRRFDLARDTVLDDLLLYDAKDLTTHGVIVGMTGSGKTGLALSLLEEAAIDGIPAIAIDPKGDLGNLMLTFPDLRPEDFRPWVDPDEAARKGMELDAFAAKTAETWRKGLAEWGQSPERIARFRDAAEVAIYTPGSSAGIPVSVLRSFAAPPAELVEDADALRERISAAVSGLLAMLGVDADPIRSREHILLSNILDRTWRAGRDLDIAGLIQAIQSPPVERIGVMDLESFFPAKERFALAMTLNNLVASPGFAAWLEGEPLDVARLLRTPEGKPRIAIMSIAHLGDAERMFFVTILLNEVLAWMRAQSGTSSLRALLYMDEVFGFFPPSANPPAKIPMLTLLKQARAFGLGVVLATQNPVDLDYKGLSNAGTWFIGRLQTERDKMRVLDGLEGASASAGSSFDRGRMEATLAALKSRVFLMNNVHEDEPVLLHTRWALSYLRGPLTRKQIAQLMAGRAAPSQAAAPASRAAAPSVPPAEAPTPRPAVPPEVPQLVLAHDGADTPYYRPALLGAARVHFVDRANEVDRWEELTLLAPMPSEETASVWEQAERLEGEPRLAPAPHPDASFASLPAVGSRPRAYTLWQKALADHLYRGHALTLLQHLETKLVSRPGEERADFIARVAHAGRERRDAAVEKLRARYAPRLASLQERLRRAEERVAREQAQYDQQKMHTMISVGATVLGALFGRKVASVGNVGRATTAMRSASRIGREKEDVARVQESVESVRQQLADLEAEFQREATELQAGAPADAALTEVRIPPRKSDIAIVRVALAWLP